MKVLITGASGYVGGAVAKYISDNGNDVDLLLRKKSVVSENIKNSRNIKCHYIDIDYDGVYEVVKLVKPDCVIHLASLFLSQHDKNQLDDLIDSNLKYGLYLLEAMKNCGVTKLINTGTSWQHFHKQSYEPVNLYAATKQAFQNMVEYYVSAHSFDVITLKLFDTYGPGDQRQKLVHLLLKLESTGDSLKMSPGKQEINMVHIHDVCTAYYTSLNLLLNRQSNEHSVYAVSAEETMTLKSFVSIFESVRKKKINIEWGGREYRDREVMEVWSDYQLVPGWKQTIDLCEGLRSL